MKWEDRIDTALCAVTIAGFALALLWLALIPAGAAA